MRRDGARDPEPMTLDLLETDHAVTLNPSAAASATVIWLHGLGADGYDFVPIVTELRLPVSLAIRFVFPHASVRPVTINGGYEMRAWYDIKALTATGRDNAEGLEASVERIASLVEREQALGVAASRIVLAGFSQGGAVALHAALAAPARLAGVVALSTYLPRAESVLRTRSAANRGLPILMCHGTNDPVVDISMGIAARDALTAAGDAVEWHAYPMQHEVSAREIAEISRWLVSRLG